MYVMLMSGLPWWLSSKKKILIRKSQVSDFIPGLGRSLDREMTTHSSILAWEIPWTEEPNGLLSIGSQNVRHD